MSELFEVVAINPNDTSGGGGCLCHEGKDTDCNGPYAVFYGNEMESNLSPAPVLGIQCARAFIKKAEGEDVLAGGERGAETVPDV